MSDTEITYRLFGVFDNGGTIGSGEMVEVDDVPVVVSDWLRRNDGIAVINIVKVTRNYD